MAKRKGDSGGVAEDRLNELEVMIMCGDDIDPAKWGREMKALAERYPDEFGYLAKEAGE